MKVGVFGTGGVGGYFGGRLAQHGEDVVFIARGEHLHEIQSNGLRVDSIKGDFWLRSVQATDDPQGAGEVDLILVGVKAHQVVEAADRMRPMVGEETFILPLQNGVESPTLIAEVLGKKHVLGGLCRISSFKAAPGHIRHVAIEPYIAFGELDNHPRERCRSLLKIFSNADIKAEIPDDIHVAMWEKFTFISAVSGVCGVTRGPVGAVRGLPETRKLLILAMQEVTAVAKAHKIDLHPDFVTNTMTFIDNIPESTRPSMQRDLIAGQPSELSFLNGAVVRLGGAVGIPTPVNEFLYASLLPQELISQGEINL
jgi:2-dehydropantoate 2-reductase